MSNRDDFEALAAELGEMFLNQAMNKATVDGVRDEKFIPRVTDELWNAFVAGQESVDRINEAEPVPVGWDHGGIGDVSLHVEKRGRRSLMFKGAGERLAAFNILREWRGCLDALQEMGSEAAENGRTVQEYGGSDLIDGRIREQVGRELEDWAVVLRMRADATRGDILMADLEDKIGNIDELIERNRDKITEGEAASDAVKEMVDQNPLVKGDPDGVKAENEARLAALLKFKDELENEGCLNAANIRLYNAVTADIRKCENEIKNYAPRRHNEALVKDRKKQDEPLPTDVRARITTYNGMLVTEVLGDPMRGKDENGWFPKTEKRFGSNIDHPKARLEISKEAIEVMRKIPRGSDDVGDLMWSWNKGVSEFTWWGPMNRIIDPWRHQTARTFRIWPGQYIECENTVPVEAVDFIQLQGGSEVSRNESLVAWKEPCEVPE